jgi:hypothetical protein
MIIVFFSTPLKILTLFTTFDAHINENIVVFAFLVFWKIETSFTDIHVSKDVAMKATNYCSRDTLNFKRFGSLQIT